jgi:hypothetical protein
LQRNLSPGQSTWLNASLYKGPWTWRTSDLIIVHCVESFCNCVYASWRAPPLGSRPSSAGR